MSNAPGWLLVRNRAPLWLTSSNWPSSVRIASLNDTGIVTGAGWKLSPRSLEANALPFKPATSSTPSSRICRVKKLPA
ncbi:hypothetical protein D3C75_1292740 [compost metagenome]